MDNADIWPIRLLHFDAGSAGNASHVLTNCSHMNTYKSYDMLMSTYFWKMQYNDANM